MFSAAAPKAVVGETGQQDGGVHCRWLLTAIVTGPSAMP